MNPKTGVIYKYSSTTGAYSSDNPNNLSTHTIPSSGESYHTSASGEVVHVDQEGRVLYRDPENGSIIYSDPENGLVNYVKTDTGETVYVDPITKVIGFIRDDGYVVFTNSAGKNYYVNINTGVMTNDIVLHNFNNVFQTMR
tara:strand:- start:3279 stop:3701 length:423 start_codon:yes stop_codon:yes gene_type:complete